MRFFFAQIALAPTGRILFYSRYPTMLGVAYLYLLKLIGVVDILLVDCGLDNKIPCGITWLEWDLSPSGPLAGCQDIY